MQAACDVPMPKLKPSKTAIEKSRLLKLKTEQYYKNLVQQTKERSRRIEKLETSLEQCTLDEPAKEEIIARHCQKEAEFERSKRTRLSLDDFRTLQIIGRGAFGLVKLVQKLDNGRIYAMKTMRKADMIKNSQMGHVKSERDLLSEVQSPWVVELFYSFQDPNYLTLVMEYLAGGDMMSLLIKFDTFSEEMAKFYIAECVLAIESIHALGFIHRDIKPDNILLDAKGHIKLTDFGLSTGFHNTHKMLYYEKFFESYGIPVQMKKSRSGDKLNEDESSGRIDMTLKGRDRIENWKRNRRALAFSTVGTPDYVAPEVFGRMGYGKECDWWSLGAIMFEMLYGHPPFMADTQPEVCQRILRHKECLKIPDEPKVSEACKNLVRRLLTDSDKRLGLFGSNEIKSHPFFVGIDWENLRNSPAPFQPVLKTEDDTAYFPSAKELDLDRLDPSMVSGGDTNTMKQQKDLAFVGYTYRRFQSLKPGKPIEY